VNIHDTVHQSKKDYKHVLSLQRGKIHWIYLDIITKGTYEYIIIYVPCCN